MIQLNGQNLSIEQLGNILYNGEKIEIAEEAKLRVVKSREAVERIVQQDKTVYGINTGFGKFSDVKIAEHEVSKLQVNLIRSHACGFGEPFSEHVAKAMMVLRLNALLKLM